MTILEDRGKSVCNHFCSFQSTSLEIQRISKAIDQVSSQDFPVMILGETGTGKELVASAIHSSGKRRTKPFVAVDCGALNPNLIESELFGHVRGAFTGADSEKNGLMLAAEDGTLFLDEIAELPLLSQAALLRVLQERKVRRIGATSMLPFSARVISATNRDLTQAIARREFRQDLYFRLGAFKIKLPPLRERRNDVPKLAQNFLASFLEPTRKMTISEAAMGILMSYSWPGNIRELEYTIQCLVATSTNDTVDVDNLPGELFLPYPTDRSQGRVSGPLSQAECQMILRAIDDFGGNKRAAAQFLGMGKSTIYRKLKNYGPVHKVGPVDNY